MATRNKRVEELSRKWMSDSDRERIGRTAKIAGGTSVVASSSYGRRAEFRKPSDAQWAYYSKLCHMADIPPLDRDGFNASSISDAIETLRRRLGFVDNKQARR